MTHGLERYFLTREIEHCGFTYLASTGERKAKRECDRTLWHFTERISLENLVQHLIWWCKFTTFLPLCVNLCVYVPVYMSWWYACIRFMCGVCIYECYMHEILCGYGGKCVVSMCEYVLMFVVPWVTCVRWGCEWGVYMCYGLDVMSPKSSRVRQHKKVWRRNIWVIALV